MRILEDLRCSWCEAHGDYETPEQAVEDGWFHVEGQQNGEFTEFDFCSMTCLISLL